MALEKMEVDKHQAEISNLKEQARLRIKISFKNGLLIGLVSMIIAFLTVGFLVWKFTPERIKENMYFSITSADAANEAVEAYPLFLKYKGSNGYSEALSRACIDLDGNQIPSCK